MTDISDLPETDLPGTDLPGTHVADVSEDSLALPIDVVGWRSLVTAMAPRDLLRLVQADKGVARAVFLGFRAGADTLKNPAVMNRIVDLAARQPIFGRVVALAASARNETPPVTATQTAATQTAATTLAETSDAEISDSDEIDIAGGTPAGDKKIRQKLKELRATVKESAARIAEMESSQAGAQRELLVARAEIETERKARLAAEAIADREKRQRERDARRGAMKPGETERAEPDATATTDTAPPETSATPTRLPGSNGLSTAVEDAMKRLLNRGKHAAVSDLCRELLAVEGLGAAGRGAVHSLNAQSLYGQAQEGAGEEQDRLAIGAFLDAGLVGPAADVFSSLLSHGPAAALRAAEVALLQRLLTLSTKLGQLETVQTTLSRLRVTSPNGYQRLRRALQQAGKKHNALLDALTASASGARLHPDEAVALPGTGPSTASVTPRRLADAVDSGDEAFLIGVRDAIETLRRNDPSLADALLESVAAIHPTALFPLTNPLTRPVVVDASNVARFNPDPMAAYMSAKPPVSVGNLTAMRDYLLRRGFFPVVMIADANLRYLVDEKPAFTTLLERGIVVETAPGIEADGTLIAEARDRVAPLITNDRLAEWGDAARRIERVAFDIYPGGIVTLTPL